MESILHKNFNLSESEFEDLCLQLKRGNERILERIFSIHFPECQKYLKVQLKADHDESYDATMQTLLNFRRSLLLSKIKYGNLRFLFTQMAYYEVLRKRKDSRVNMGRDFVYYQTANLEIETEELEAHTQLKQAINSLNENQKKLLTHHYYQKQKLIDIADAEGVPNATIRKRKERIIKLLKSKLNLFNSKSNEVH